ncbi:MAG: [FeFe] hydrogenase H-cluster maturation GTPase HydF [Candidatus Gastranaerophilales bacterium]|nr:[FeFe] hydrogenase H-cluster maturation GTPase HydF [Candidatus Gastranaerophilales bacterium]
MKANNTPKSMRLHIGIFGKRNAGKSSVTNIITHQDTSIVSAKAGTTTDAVEKTMEMLPIGSVVIIDTAGIDDTGSLGKERVKKSQKVSDRTDAAIIVCDGEGWNKYEFELAEKFNKNNIPIIAVINKSDIKQPDKTVIDKISEKVNSVIVTSAKTDKKLAEKIREALIRCVPDSFINPPAILEGIVKKEDTVILVTPIDKEAPKGRLILPQVNVLRELLDNNCITVVVTEKQLSNSLKALKKPPKCVITDSQAFKEVSEIVPESIPLTSFSILFARLKGDLKTFYDGAKQIDNLKDGDKILICESCTHHPIEDDIGRVKIPNLLKKKTGKKLVFENVSSHEFPTDIEKYKLIVHCGGCMTNRREILSRINKSREKNVSVTNYGIAISYCLGICERAMKPFFK